MLTQLVLFVFLLCGVAALTIDLGLVRLTQSQMQNAADTAALEGLRQRDALSDADRRTAASNMAALTFDDDADLTTVNTQRNLGAGPDVNFLNPPDGQLNPSQLYDPDSSGVYKPTRADLTPGLELNAAAIQQPYGDLVTGKYYPPPSICTTATCLPFDDLQTEDSSYSRHDFDPNDPDKSAFLVRLRRTTPGRNALDREAGVSSSGNSLPLMFGQVSVINSPIDTNAYSPRRDGITVRATTIANAVPALRVGSAVPAVGLLGATHFAVSRDLWTCLVTNGSDHISVVNGTSVMADVCPGVGLTVSDAKVVGGNIACMPTTGFIDIAVTAYVPIYTQMPDLANAVIGFGQVQISTTGTITPVAGQIVKNATSLINGSPTCVDHLAEARAYEVANPTPELILAPVIVR